MKLILWRPKNRRIEASELATPGPAKTRSTISCRVRSGSATSSASSQSACGSSGERLLPPRALGLTPPVWACNRVHRIAEETLTLKRAAACRREAPDKTSPTTRARRSSECADVPITNPKSEANRLTAKCQTESQRRSQSSHLKRYSSAPIRSMVALAVSALGAMAVLSTAAAQDHWREADYRDALCTGMRMEVQLSRRAGRGHHGPRQRWYCPVPLRSGSAGLARHGQPHPAGRRCRTGGKVRPAHPSRGWGNDRARTPERGPKC